MSRVAKQPVDLPQGVTATITADVVTLKGAKGTLSVPLKGGVKVVQADKHLEVQYDDDNRMQAGATRAHLANIVEGVTKGYERKLEIVGVGWDAKVAGKKITLKLGYADPIELAIPDGLTVAVDQGVNVTITGIDRQKVGAFASLIRSKRKPEPYNGKGVKYSDEVIQRKQGKAFGA